MLCFFSLSLFYLSAHPLTYSSFNRPASMLSCSYVAIHPSLLIPVSTNLLYIYFLKFMPSSSALVCPGFDISEYTQFQGYIPSGMNINVCTYLHCIVVSVEEWITLHHHLSRGMYKKTLLSVPFLPQSLSNHGPTVSGT